MKNRFLLIIAVLCLCALAIFNISCGDNSVTTNTDSNTESVVDSDTNVDTTPTDSDSSVDSTPVDSDSNVDSTPVDSDSNVDSTPTDSDSSIDTDTTDKECSHKWESSGIILPSCEVDGKTSFTCALCGDSYDVAIPALKHDEIKHDRVEPTCTEKGNEAYVTCTRCDYTTFVEIPALKHDEIKHDRVEPTCTENGNEAYVTCSRCDYTTFKEIPALKHDEVPHEKVDATCTTVGNEAYVTCSRCDYTTFKEIPALKHDEVPHDRVEPSCTEKGNEAYVTCTRCAYTTFKEIPALKHDEISHVKVEPTCTEKGNEAYVTCSRCAYTTFKEIPALKHDEIPHDRVEPTCTTVGNEAYVTCSRCTYTTYKEIPKLDHTYSADLHKDSIHHYYECECGARKDEQKHISSGPATAQKAEICTVCGYVIKEATGITFKTLNANGTSVYGKVPNTQEVFSFIDEVAVNGNSRFVVSLDIYGKDVVSTKNIPLVIGDNTVYVTEIVDNEPVNLYTVTIRRKPIYEVTFNTNGGTRVETQYVEEDALANVPTTTKAGYTFISWSYDFTQPIVDNTNISATWEANKNTPYKVEYYLQNLEDNNYTLYETDNLTGTTDIIANATQKSYEHFTFNAQNSITSGNINGDGSLVLKLYYTRDSYKIVVNGEYEKAGTSTQVNGNYPYDKGITVTAIVNVGYTFLGWYEGENLVCEDLSYTFNVERNVTYTAKWEANKNTPYMVEHYLQNLDNDDYTLFETNNLTGITDTTATVVQNTYEHFTFSNSNSNVSGNINGDGSLVLKIYYTRNTYTVSMNKYSFGSITNSGSYKYGTKIMSTATIKLGYNFLGWYGEGKLISNDTNFEAVIDKNIVAKFELKPEMSNFNFTSTSTECIITGIKNTTITEILVPECVTDIGAYAFNGSNITRIDISNQVTTIGDCAFLNCTGLTDIIIPDNVTTIGAQAFSYCNSLKNIYLGSGVTEIKHHAFSGCNSLTNVNIPSSINIIGQGAFYNCDNLISMTLPFVGESKTATTYKSVFGYIFDCTNELSSDTIDGKTYQYYDSTQSHFKYYHYSIPSSLKSVTITGGTINAYSFRNCNNLTNIVLGENVTSINKYAFYNCSSVINMLLSENVTDIGEYAFSGCNSLTIYCKAENKPSEWSSSWNNSNRPVVWGVLDQGVTENGLVWVRLDEEKEAIILGYCMVDTQLIIPTQINGYTVTHIASKAFYSCTGITSIIIPETITNIEAFALYGCSNLTDITLPFVGENKLATSHNSVLGYIFGYVKSFDDEIIENTTYQYSDISTGEYYHYYIPNNLKTVKILGGLIGTNAFYNCSNLTSIKLPQETTSIGNQAFYNCSSLTGMKIPDTITIIGNNAFYNCSALIGIYIHDIANWCKIDFVDLFSNPLYYAKNLYVKNELVSELVIPNDATFISNYAFYNCIGVTKVMIGENVKTIGYSSFGGCDSITDVIIGNSVSSIAYGAFYGCNGIKSITVGDNNITYKSIDGNLYSRDGKNFVLYAIGKTDTKFTIPDGVIEIEKDAFKNCVSLISIEAPNTVTEIGSYAFYGCTSLTNIIIPEAVTAISDYMFCNCNSLTSIIIPKAVTVIGDFAFRGCSSLKSIEIGDSLTTIGSSAFSACTSLTRIEIPNSVTTIGASAFYNCDGLTSFVIPESITAVSEKMFYDCDGLTNIVIPNNITIIGNAAFYHCGALESIVIGNGVTSIGDFAFYNCKKITNIDIPNSVTIIGKNAFSACYKLADILLGNNVTHIGDYAFRDCAPLKSIVIPDSVTHIGDHAFEDCTSLKSIVIPDSVTSIGSYAFYDCNSLTSVVIGDGVTSIGHAAFRECTGLTTIIIPDSVIEIGSFAFYGCNKLVSISLPFVGGSRTANSYDSVFGYIFGYRVVTYNSQLEGTTCQYEIYNRETQLIDSYYYYIPESLKSVIITGESIADRAFNSCGNLTNIVITDNVNHIGTRAFSNCNCLTIYCEFVDKPDGWDGDWNVSNRPVVWGCKAFGQSEDGLLWVRNENDFIIIIGYVGTNSTLEISSYIDNCTVSTIGERAFYDCDSLTSVVIPNSVTTIGSSAFSGCDSLTIYCEATSKPSGWNSSWNYSNCPVVWGYKG